MAERNDRGEQNGEYMRLFQSGTAAEVSKEGKGMKKIGRKMFLTLTLCFCLITAVFAVSASAAGTVNNATVKKIGKYYIGYKKSGKKIRNKWGIVKVSGKTYWSSWSKAKQIKISK